MIEKFVSSKLMNREAANDHLGRKHLLGTGSRGS